MHLHGAGESTPLDNKGAIMSALNSNGRTHDTPIADGHQLLVIAERILKPLVARARVLDEHMDLIQEVIVTALAEGVASGSVADEKAIEVIARRCISRRTGERCRSATITRELAKHNRNVVRANPCGHQSRDPAYSAAVPTKRIGIPRLCSAIVRLAQDTGRAHELQSHILRAAVVTARRPGLLNPRQFLTFDRAYVQELERNEIALELRTSARGVTATLRRLNKKLDTALLADIRTREGWPETTAENTNHPVSSEQENRKDSNADRSWTYADLKSALTQVSIGTRVDRRPM